VGTGFGKTTCDKQKLEACRLDLFDATRLGAAGKEKPAPAIPTPVVQDLGIVALRFLAEAEVGSIRRRPVGGGLGVYEPVPDRTVSGNEGKFVGHWGVSADKKRQECGRASPINTECFRLLPFCD
jgi:hypothetical protein